MSKVFVTSDLHFGHDNILKYCNRPFRDIHEMNEYIVAEWNRRVGDTDTVYILGDVAMGPRSSDPQYASSFLSRLKGKKRVVLGNHDRPVTKRFLRFTSSWNIIFYVSFSRFVRRHR